MKGIAYCVGVGPGDPELMTLKAVRLIKENEVMAFPGEDPKETAAYKIAAAAVPQIAEKTLLPLCMPMVKDRQILEEEHKKAAKAIEQILEKGENVVFLTLGDPTLYCTFSYLQRILEEDGYKTELVSGVSSVHASAAKLGIPLTEWDEPLHIYPAVHGFDPAADQNGTVVLMKAGSGLAQIKDRFPAGQYDLKMAENGGMENERLYQSADEIPDRSGYYTTVIIKKKRSNR